MITRECKYSEAINEALAIKLETDPSVYIMGLGAGDRNAVFGTLDGLAERFGTDRVLDTPVSENAMTGICIGAAVLGMRPVMVHQRLDFILMAMDQVINAAAKWHYMSNGAYTVPLTIRLVVGRGWGQGPQHAQALHAWFSHIPGLKVVAPFSPSDAKALLLAAIEDDNPVIFIEHRWLHNTYGGVREDAVPGELGKAAVLRKGEDVTVVAASHMTLEALRCADVLDGQGIGVEVVDLRTLRPMDTAAILKSLRKTGRLVVADMGWPQCGFGSEVTALCARRSMDAFKVPPALVSMADYPSPTSAVLAEACYPGAMDIAAAITGQLGVSLDLKPLFKDPDGSPTDVPDARFFGPF